MIYLDIAATTKPLNSVVNIVTESLKNDWFNSSALYNNAKLVKTKLLNAKKIIAKSICASPDEIFFTSGGSESNNWVFQGFVKQALLDNVTPIIITTPIEHKSIILCCDYLKQTGIEVYYLSVDDDGMIDIGELEDRLSKISISHKFEKFRILVSVQHANNEIGTIQNISRIADIVHYYNALFHTDAVQTYGKVLFATKGADFISISGHKIGATKGIGFLYINKNVLPMIQPLIYGTQNINMRGGTENISAILGLSQAVSEQVLNNDLQKAQETLQDKRSILISLLRDNFDCIINGANLVNRQLSNIISVTFNYNITGEALIYMLDTNNISIAAGSACNSQLNQPSYVLKAIGKTDSEALRTIRISFDNSVTYNDIQSFIFILKKNIKILNS